MRVSEDVWGILQGFPSFFFRWGVSGGFAGNVSGVFQGVYFRSKVVKELIFVPTIKYYLCTNHRSQFNRPACLDFCSGGSKKNYSITQCLCFKVLQVFLFTFNKLTLSVFPIIARCHIHKKNQGATLTFGQNVTNCDVLKIISLNSQICLQNISQMQSSENFQLFR